MDEQTTILEKPNESQIFTISIRALLVIAVVGTVCYMSIVGKKIDEPLYTLVGLIVGTYFGQQTKPKSQTQ